MKAISIRPEFAHLIACGWKSIEVRTWQIKAPADLLMVTSKRKYPYFPYGYAVGVIHIEAISELHEGLLQDAFMDEMPEKKSYAWHISSYTPCKPFEFKGKLHIYEVPQNYEDLETLPDDITPANIINTLYNWYKPLCDEMPATLDEAITHEAFEPLLCAFGYAE